MQSDSKRACRLWGDPAVTTTMAGLEADPRSDHRVLVRPQHGLVGLCRNGRARIVLFWALVVAGIVALVVFVSGDRQKQQSPPSPEQILAARFVRGEISETEYRDRLAILRDPARH